MNLIYGSIFYIEIEFPNRSENGIIETSAIMMKERLKYRRNGEKTENARR